MEFVRAVEGGLLVATELIVIVLLLAIAAGVLYVLGWTLLIGLVGIGVLIENTVKRLRRPKAIEVWRPTKDEWKAFIDAGLARLGITYDELARQARERDFQSSEARMFWLLAEGKP